MREMRSLSPPVPPSRKIPNEPTPAQPSLAGPRRRPLEEVAHELGGGRRCLLGFVEAAPHLADAGESADSGRCPFEAIQETLDGRRGEALLQLAVRLDRARIDEAERIDALIDAVGDDPRVLRRAELDMRPALRLARNIHRTSRRWNHVRSLLSTAASVMLDREQVRRSIVEWDRFRRDVIAELPGLPDPGPEAPSFVKPSGSRSNWEGSSFDHERKAFLANHPRCVVCDGPATQLDHLVRLE